MSYAVLPLLSLLTLGHASEELLNEQEGYLPYEEAMLESVDEAFTYTLAEADEEMEYAANGHTSQEAYQDAKFGSAQPILSEGIGFYFSGDYLFWKAEEDGLHYGLQSENFGVNQPFPQSNPFKGVFGKPQGFASKYHSGYRVSLGTLLPRDEWELFLTWTDYTSSTHSSIDFKSNKAVFPYWIDEHFFPVAQSAAARWNLHFNTLDFDLGRNLFIGKHLTVRPFFGFQGAWIEQKLQVKYFNMSFVFPTIPAFNVSSHNRNIYQGYGMRLGVDGRWFLGSGLHLIGSISGSLLYGKFKFSHFAKTLPSNPRAKLKNHKQLVTPQLFMFGGVGWETQFHTSRVWLNLHIGWEEQIWLHQNQFQRYVDAYSEAKTISEEGNLTLQGLTAGATLGF